MACIRCSHIHTTVYISTFIYCANWVFKCVGVCLCVCERERVTVQLVTSDIYTDRFLLENSPFKFNISLLCCGSPCHGLRYIYRGCPHFQLTVSSVLTELKSSAYIAVAAGVILTVGRHGYITEKQGEGLRLSLPAHHHALLRGDSN